MIAWPAHLRDAAAAASALLALASVGTLLGSCSFETDLDSSFTTACQVDAECPVGQRCGPEGYCYEAGDVQLDLGPDGVSAEPDATLCGAAACASGRSCCVDDAGASVCTDTTRDPSHCGACGSSCDAGERCAAGVCVCRGATGSDERCNIGEACCGDGCADLDESEDHCGACGVACGDGESCVDGACACGEGAACGAGTTCCDGACVAPDDPSCDCGPAGPCLFGDVCCRDGASPVCRDLDLDAQNCGACGRLCVAGEVCRGGDCECDTGRADCNGDPLDGCEVNLGTDATHCGLCGLACGAGQLCAAGDCVCPDGQPLGATSNCGACGVACGSDEACCDGVCQALSTDPLACGGCGTICESTETCCDGSCAPLDADPAHCGVCGNACGSGESCCSGQCVDLATDPTDCGVCGTACTAPAGARAICVDGGCDFACTAGRADCDLDPGNGCETSLVDDASSCGACGAVCASIGGTAACLAGSCVLVCAAGFADCDSDPSNGCEVTLGSDLSNCGGCGTECPDRHAAASCTAGTCSFVCNGSYADCNGDANDGCEVDLTSASAHCGACGAACPTGLVCNDGTCGSSTCSRPGDIDCGGTCFDLSSSDQHCGTCANDCTAYAGTSTSSCDGGTCVYTCAAMRGDCTTSPGCETRLDNDFRNCGACGNVCPSGNGAAVCNAGVCGLVCNAGWANCDGVSSNGCETSLNTSVSHCGACGQSCSAPNATATCTVGQCSVACLAGYADCDGNAANGCEARFSDDPQHCGGCNQACSSNHATPTCSSGSCAPVCDAGYANCDGSATNGCEVILGTTQNCTACGDRCTGAEICCPGGCTRDGTCG